jgi:hypothetical protein
MENVIAAIIIIIIITIITVLSFHCFLNYYSTNAAVCILKEGSKDVTYSPRKIELRNRNKT